MKHTIVAQLVGGLALFLLAPWVGVVLFQHLPHKPFAYEFAAALSSAFAGIVVGIFGVALSYYAVHVLGGGDGDE